jgi:hypothetical protein
MMFEIFSFRLQCRLQIAVGSEVVGEFLGTLVGEAYQETKLYVLIKEEKKLRVRLLFKNAPGNKYSDEKHLFVIFFSLFD